MNRYLFLLIFFGSLSQALTFKLPETGDVVGKLQTAVVKKGESLADIGRYFDVGIYEIMEANPNVDPWVPTPGTLVIIPTQFILPNTERDGIIINLAEMRLYYYHPNKKLVTTHPIGIGRKGWQTPLGSTRITQKRKDPTWTPPTSIRKLYASRGEELPSKVLPGPDNPLGEYAMRLAIPGYLIHGTNRPGGIGVRSSSGCIRLYPEDIKSLFYQVKLNTNVQIIHDANKYGKHQGKLYLEAHEPLSEDYYQEAEANDIDVGIELKFNSPAFTTSHGYPMLVR